MSRLIKNKTTPNILFLLAVLAMSAMSVVSYFVAPKTMLAMDNIYNVGVERPLPPILAGEEIEQNFRTGKDNLSGISIFFATYGGGKNSELHIKVTDLAEQKVIHDKTVSAGELKDNSYYKVEFDKQSKSAGKDYRLQITTRNKDEEQAVTIWLGKIPAALNEAGSVNKISSVQVNGEAYDGLALRMEPLYLHTNVLRLLRLVVPLFAVLIVLSAFGVDMQIKAKHIIWLTYALFAAFFVYRLFFYGEYLSGYPDEGPHVSYIANLKLSGKFFPDFFKLTQLKEITPPMPNQILEQVGMKAYEFSGNTNYLGHPPLYYWIMQFFVQIEVDGSTIYLSVQQMRQANWVMATAGMLLLFYIGYTRIKHANPLPHLVFCVAATSVPMFVPGMAGVTNDTLAFLGVTIFALGLIRFAEKKRDWKTYWITCAGVCIALMSKLTAGLGVVVALMVFVVILGVKEKGLKWMLSKSFISTIPIYLLVAFYFLMVYKQVGTVQPTLSRLNLQQFINSSFFVPVENRVQMSFFEYIIHYWRSFLLTWTGIISHTDALEKGFDFFDFSAIGTVALLFMPFFLLIFSKKVRKSNIGVFVLSVYIGIIVTAIVQFFNGWKGFVAWGYPGAFQSRYYLCFISAIALAAGLLSERMLSKKSEARINAAPSSSAVPAVAGRTIIYNIRHEFNLIVIVLFIVSMFYGDFIYYLLNAF